MHTKTIGLIAHTGKRGVAELINSIAKEFERFSISILFEKETARVAGKQRGYPVAELGAMTDLLVVAGGDGSILRVIGQLGEMIKPIFGINVGSLGFLTCASSSNYRKLSNASQKIGLISVTVRCSRPGLPSATKERTKCSR